MSKYHYTYKDLYESFSTAVIVIPSGFMYEGKENSARIMSYLLEIKLMEQRSGLIAASPDIERITRELKNSHINYYVLTHGEIVDSCTFEDNAFNKYLELAKSQPIWMYNSATYKYDIEKKE